MSQEICHAVMQAIGQGAAKYAGLHQVSAINVPQLMALFEKYGLVVLQAAADVLPLVAPGAKWADVLVKIIGRLIELGVNVSPDNTPAAN